MEEGKKGEREGVIDYFKTENQETGILVFFKGKRMTSIPLSYFKAQKFTIASKSHLLFFLAPILISDVLKWFCASDHREEF